MDKDCIFCKIASHEIPKKPEEVMFEDEEVMAFLDIHPVALGHTILIPKAHFEWFYEVPEELSNKWFSAAKQIGKKLKNEYTADYMRLSIVGKDVPHAHIHLIPSKLSDKNPSI